MYKIVVLLAILALVSVSGFRVQTGRASVKVGQLASSVTDAPTKIKEITCPDFYWEFRLDRLVSKKGGELEFAATSYPEANNAKDLYDAYYLDLTLNGKLSNFDWMGEKEVSDSEWLGIYKKICDWTATTAAANKPTTHNLPANDFDLLQQFYPALSFRDLEAPFVEAEVGANFPYNNMKEMLGAAMEGKLAVAGYDGKKITSIEADNIRSELASLKDSTMKKIDDIYADAIKYASNPFPDEKAKTHYKNLRTKLADFPDSPQGWSTFRADMEKQVDEMARLASKPVDEHHGHHSSGPSVAEEFEAKYGKSLEEIQERFNAYKNDPDAFLENSIVEKYGRNGLEIWKKSQEFSSNMSTMSQSDKSAVEKQFSDFIGSA